MPVFKRYQNITHIISARSLNQEDVEQRQGVIHTSEGAVSFHAGDYLAQNLSREFLISREKMERGYRRLTDTTDDEWASYEPLEIDEAAQLTEACNLDGHHGHPGDYLVRGKEGHWIVDRDTFHASYMLVEDE